MCVALPGTVIETGSGRSIVDFGGNRVGQGFGPCGLYPPESK